MNKIKINIPLRKKLMIGLSLLIMASCNGFLDVEPPIDKITGDQVFQDNAAATGAMVGIYLDMYARSSFAGGAAASISSLAGLSADELHNDPAADPIYLAFERNSLTADNASILSLWSSMYKVIYQANVILENLSKSNGVTQTTQKQLRGEALFLRAFSSFYLINCFGDVPLILSTDYKTNALATRIPVQNVYAQIESDLLEAESLLTINYVTEGKSRPNKFTATAMLARVYLYREKWALAEQKSSEVIEQNGLYGLVQNLNSVFLAKSQEAIWQLQPQDGATYTIEDEFFGSTFKPIVLTQEILAAFEPNDKRKTTWINSLSASVNLSYKYKKHSSNLGPQAIEYAVALRLAEQYLIRAEARTMQSKLSEAIADVDAIRERAGLTLIKNTNPEISKDELMRTIEKERRLELMVEWGHRWFDLKRWERANTVLASIKPNWNPTDELYPLPAQEIKNNPNLRPQNIGY